MIIGLADIINSILQCILFVNTINFCTSIEYKKSKLQRVCYILILFTIISVTTILLGNSSLSTIILHIIMFVFGAIIYKKDLLTASIVFSLIYSCIVITLIVSSTICLLFGEIITNTILYSGIIYLSQFTLACLILIKRKSICSLCKVIKSRNKSIVYLIIFTVILDFIVSFNSIVHNRNEDLFKELIFILLCIFLILVTVYFGYIDKKSKEIDSLNLALRDNIELLKKIKHDYGAQISYLYGLHLMGKHDRLGQLLKSIIDNHNNINEDIIISSKDSIIRTIVNSINLNGIDVIIDENADIFETDVSELDFQRIVSNILRNAVNALNNSGLILISTFYNLNYFVIKLKNNGPKIEENILNKIFDAGFTTKKNEEKNNGFGLSIVKDLIETYNGKIYVSSDDSYTEFTIRLPLSKI